MGMNLSIPCSHCGAQIDEICKPTCLVNGINIQNLEKALFAVGLTLENIHTKSWKRLCKLCGGIS